jgi:hypothetical protein
MSSRLLFVPVPNLCGIVSYQEQVAKLQYLYLFIMLSAISGRKMVPEIAND